MIERNSFKKCILKRFLETKAEICLQEYSNNVPYSLQRKITWTVTLPDDIFSWWDHPLPPPPSSSSSSHFSFSSSQPTESHSRLSISTVMQFRGCWFSKSLSRFYSEDKLCFQNIWWGEAASSIYILDICFYRFFACLCIRSNSKGMETWLFLQACFL